MKKPEVIRNVTIKPSTHILLRAEKRRTGINIKVLVDKAIVSTYGKQASA